MISAGLSIASDNVTYYGGPRGLAQGLGYASLAFAVAGGIQEIGGAISKFNAARSAAQNARVAADLGVSTEPYYSAGDLARSFNNVQADVFEKVAAADKLIAQAAQARDLAAELGGLQDTWSPFDFVGGIGGAGKAAVSAGLNAGERAVFYSGGNIAKEQALIYARNIGGRTILQTPIGKALEVMKAPDFAWRGASGVFASTTRGEAHVFLGEGASWSRTFGSVEAEILEKNGTEIIFH